MKHMKRACVYNGKVRSRTIFEFQGQSNMRSEIDKNEHLRGLLMSSFDGISSEKRAHLL